MWGCRRLSIMAEGFPSSLQEEGRELNLEVEKGL